MDLTRIQRHRYIIEDPARLGCLVAAGALLFAPDIPFWLTLAVVGVMQLAPVMMAARGLEQGWSRRWGPRVHASVFASNLAMDFTSLAACSVTGALLLARHYDSAEVIKPLAILAVAICFLPDVRLCRWLLSGDPVEQSRQLSHGPFLRDPVLLGAMLATGVACLLDRVSLQYVFFSLLFLQFNALFVLVDKYLPEIESRNHSGWRTLLLGREGRRLWMTVAPLFLIPLRLAAGDRASWVGAALITLVIVIPDLYRMTLALVTGAGNLVKVTPAQAPATYIVLPK